MTVAPAYPVLRKPYRCPFLSRALWMKQSAQNTSRNGTSCIRPRGKSHFVLRLHGIPAYFQILFCWDWPVSVSFLPQISLPTLTVCLVLPRHTELPSLRTPPPPCPGRPLLLSDSLGMSLPTTSGLEGLELGLSAAPMGVSGRGGFSLIHLMN